MLNYFDVECRKKYRKQLVNWLYEILKRTNYPSDILAFVIKAWHFVAPYLCMLIFIFAPIHLAVMLIPLLILYMMMFFYLKGCFVSHLEYKLCPSNAINIMDPYLVLVGWPINDENRHYITHVLIFVYFLFVLPILYVRSE